NNNNGNTKRDTGYISFRLDGREVKLDFAAAAWSDSGDRIASVIGTQKNGFETFQIVLEGIDLNVCSIHSLVDEKKVNLSYYTPDRRMPFSNIIGFVNDNRCSGSLKVTKKKLVPILGSYAFSATFSGIALDENEKTHQITDGFIYDSRSE
ncbi:MAG: hypothetical protein WBB17_03865, partial [Saprospiraceae bacterium]